MGCGSVGRVSLGRVLLRKNAVGRRECYALLARNAVAHLAFVTNKISNMYYYGDITQLVECHVRNVEVVSSSLIISTNGNLKRTPFVREQF